MEKKYSFSGVQEGMLKCYTIFCSNGRIIKAQKDVYAGPCHQLLDEEIGKALEDAFKFSVAINKLENYLEMISNLKEEEKERYLKAVSIFAPKTIKN